MPEDLNKNEAEQANFNPNPLNKIRQLGPVKILKILSVLVVLILMIFSLTPPKKFPKNSTFMVNSGEPLGVISYKLKDKGYIRSRMLFEGLIILRQNEKAIQEGEYYFEKPVSLIRVFLRLSGKDFGINRIKFTVPEGFNRNEIAKRCNELLKNCNEDLFLDKTKNSEGFLFPDTYLMFPSQTEDDLIEKMRLNFTKKTAEIFKGIDIKKQREIIILASIIEREAVNEKDMKIISGILQNRMAKNMALQVDATFYFTLGKASSELTIKDLKSDSPYNTYVNKGLPPGPIGNPGLSAINAVLNPTKNDYLYYLHDRNGVPHYAKTYKEHSRNRNLYLK